MAPLAETSGNGATSTRDAIIASIRAKRDAPPGCVIIVFKDIVLFDSNMPPTSNLKRDREAAVQRSRFFDALFTDIDPDSGRVIHGVESFDLKGKNMLLVDAGEMDPKAFFGAIGDMSHLKTMTNFAQRRIDAVDKLKGAPMSDEEKTNLRLVLLAGSPLAKPTDNGANYGRAAALLAADILPASAVKQMLAFLGYRVEADLLEAKTDITGLQLTAAAQAARMGKTEADVSGLKAQINQVSSTANAAEAKAEEARQAAQTASAQAEQFSTELASETAARKQGEQATEAELQKYGALMEELTAHVEGDKEAWEKKAVDFERNIARAQAELAQGKEAWEKKMAGFGKKVEAIKTETRGKFNVANSVLRATDNRLMAGEQQHGELSEQCAQLERQLTHLSSLVGGSLPAMTALAAGQSALANLVEEQGKKVEEQGKKIEKGLFAKVKGLLPSVAMPSPLRKATRLAVVQDEEEEEVVAAPPSGKLHRAAAVLSPKRGRKSGAAWADAAPSPSGLPSPSAWSTFMASVMSPKRGVARAA